MRLIGKILVWMTIFGVSAGAQTGGTCRVAVVTEQEEVSAAADALSAQLSKTPNLVVLERDQINKVLREQELAVATRDYLKLGHLLSADGLLVLDSRLRGSARVLNARLIAVKPGVLLTAEDQTIPGKDVLTWADEFARHLAPILPKLFVSASNALPISVVNLRAAVESPAERTLEEELTRLSTELLTRQPEIFVLERSHMQSLTGEHDLAGLDESAFWKGSYLLEGTIDAKGYSPEQVTLSGRMVPPKGGEPIAFELSGNRTNLNELSTNLVAQILKSVTGEASVVSWNAADEARKFESEGAWALKWHLYKAAQSATESAWALGDHSRELAEARLRAYTEPIYSLNEGSGNVLYPMVPEPSQLPWGIRSAALYCDDSALVWTNSANPDFGWFELGVGIAERSLAMLDSFYNGAEFRAGNEELLRSLREETRRLISTLDAQSPPIKTYAGQFKTGVPRKKGVRYDHGIITKFERLQQVKWAQAGLSFEKPGDSLPLYLNMIESGFIPDALPRLAGWKWEDRKTLPQLASQFVDALRKSTNLHSRCCAEYCAYAMTPEDGVGGLEKVETKLASAMWDIRTNLVCEEGYIHTVTELSRTLCMKHAHYYSPYDAEPWGSFWQRLRMFAITDCPKWASAFEATAFDKGSCPLSEEDARKMVPALQARVDKNPADRKMGSHLRNVAAIAKVTPNIPAGPAEPKQAPILDSLPFTAKFDPWKISGAPSRLPLVPKLQRVIFRGDTVWAMCSYVQQGMGVAWKAPCSILKFNTSNGVCEEIEIPSEFGSPGMDFDADSESVFISLNSRLGWYHIADKKWETLPIPSDADGKIVASRGKVYFGNPDELLENDPVACTNSTLVSARRVPALNALDSVWSGKYGIDQAWDGKLCAYSDFSFSVFDAASGSWQSTQIPTNKWRVGVSYFFSTAGVERLSYTISPAQSPQHRLLVSLPESGGGAKIILRQTSGKLPDGVISEFGSGEPEWRCPDGCTMDDPTYVRDGQNLWNYEPRVQRSWSPIGHGDGKIDQDWSASLVRYSPGCATPLRIPVRFERYGQVCDPCQVGFVQPPPGFSVFGEAVPFWRLTPAGAVICSIDSHVGDWLIPSSELNRRWAEFAARNAASSIPAKPTQQAP